MTNCRHWVEICGIVENEWDSLMNILMLKEKYLVVGIFVLYWAFTCIYVIFMHPYFVSNPNPIPGMFRRSRATLLLAIWEGGLTPSGGDIIPRWRLVLVLVGHCWSCVCLREVGGCRSGLNLRQVEFCWNAGWSLVKN